MKKNLFEQDIETKMLEITMQVLLKKLYVISQQLKKISTFKHSGNVTTGCCRSRIIAKLITKT